jgi:hypothetical protein
MKGSHVHKAGVKGLCHLRHDSDLGLGILIDESLEGDQMQCVVAFGATKCNRTVRIVAAL